MPGSLHHVRAQPGCNSHHRRACMPIVTRAARKPAARKGAEARRVRSGARTMPAATEAPRRTPIARRTEAAAYEAVLKALLGGALRPGTPLRERQLAETF